MLVTADTITSAQIEQLRRDIAGHVFPAAGMAHTGLSDLWADTEDAIAVDPNSYASVEAAGRAHREARERVAAAWNARHGGDDAR